jgi:phage-related protein
MTLPIFTPPYQPSYGTILKPEVKVLRADFGDGYTQRAADGINNLRLKLELGWEYLTPANADVIINFLEARGGWQAFRWAAPDAPWSENAGVWTQPSVKTWICDDWSRKRVRFGQDSVSAVFTRVFDL